jgi:hypothetical protein
LFCFSDFSFPSKKYVLSLSVENLQNFFRYFSITQLKSETSPEQPQARRKHSRLMAKVDEIHSPQPEWWWAAVAVADFYGGFSLNRTVCFSLA